MKCFAMKWKNTRVGIAKFKEGYLLFFKKFSKEDLHINIRDNFPACHYTVKRGIHEYSLKISEDAIFALNSVTGAMIKKLTESQNVKKGNKNTPDG